MEPGVQGAGLEEGPRNARFSHMGRLGTLGRQGRTASLVPARRLHVRGNVRHSTDSPGPPSQPTGEQDGEEARPRSLSPPLHARLREARPPGQKAARLRNLNSRLLESTAGRLRCSALKRGPFPPAPTNPPSCCQNINNWRAVAPELPLYVI